MGRQVIVKRANIILLRMRAIDRFVNSKFFEENYKESQYTEVMKYIESHDVEGLKYYMERMLRIEYYQNRNFDALTLGEIRQIASRLGIENYSDYNKPSLINMVQDELSKVKRTPVGVSC